MRRRALAFGLLTLFLAACGVQERQAKDGASPIPRADYVKRVNEICAHYNALQQSLGQPAGSVEQQAAIAHQINLLSLEKIAKAREVPPPLGNRHLTRAIFDRFEEGVRTADLSTRLVTRDSAAANEAMESAVRMMDIATVELNSYGLTTCSQ